MTAPVGSVVVLAGVGGDAHSVGLIVLNRVLRRAGYRLRYLGNQCAPQDICTAALGADAVLVSNMDGHARYYLEDLPALRQEGGDTALWYLGGHPSVEASDASARELLTLGFDRVFLGYVESRNTLATLGGDLRRRGPRRPVKPGSRYALDDAGVDHGATLPAARSFDQERDEVLHQWRTGHEARDLVENAEVLRRRANLAEVQSVVDRDGGVLIHPRTGVDRDDLQRELLRALRDAGADVLSFQIDSLTRNSAYEQIEMARKRAEADEQAWRPLNGFPAVNYGAYAMRSITAEFHDVPFQVRHSTRDPRLLAELAFAAGVTGFEGGPITYNLPYYRDYAPAAAIDKWRYVDRLAGLYRQRFGVTIDREFFGVLTACLVPPCLAVAVNVLEALLAARQGVRAFSLGYAEQGNRAQDVAAIRVLRRLGSEYLRRSSSDEFVVHTVFHQYMGAFPADPGKAVELLRGSARTAGHSGAHRVMLKSYVEAARIPSAEENAESLRIVRQELDHAAGQPVAGQDGIAFEEWLIEREARAIIDATLRAGGDDIELAVVRAIDSGLIDVPFSPSRFNAGRVVTIRDSNGAIRLADTGRLPFDRDVRDFHARQVGDRLKRARRPIEQIVEDDILGIARGEFETWPLNGTAA